MNSPMHTEVLAATARQLVNGTDVTDLLARLVRSSATAMGADAVGLLVRVSTGGVELLASTSHRVSELEIFQIQQDSGPCIDTIASGRPVTVVGAEAVRARWPVVGLSIVSRGYSAVHAFPLVWRGRVLGGLNVFTGSDDAWDEQQLAVGQTFADVATLAVVHLPELSEHDLDGRIHRALEGRVVIEQAKGALAHVSGISPEEAYDHLTRLADERGATLTVVAREVIRAAARQARDGSGSGSGSGSGPA
ncbi:GAF and ANTAR domain-containing protein [Sanguibacter sp. 25GB23B1]|uniref:GAF and ANTAR domain-containing protein n=1 Tax=unclassified Sanguibacter TaxID=2645534 RepID=UPI0032AEAB47